MSVVAIRWRGVANGFVRVGGVWFVRGRGRTVGSGLALVGRARDGQFEDAE
jgi:hypothetical protein